MDTCGMSCIKYLLFVFNLIFALSGIGIITAGAVVLADVGEFSHFMEARMLAPPIVLIVVGSIIFIIAFLGCFGAIRESYAMLMTFAVFLLLIFIIELAVGIAAAVYKSGFEDALKDTLKTTLRNYGTESADRTAWDNIQRKLLCCGVEGVTDWQMNSQGIPPSCCKINDDSEVAKLVNCITGYYETGCLTRLKLKVQEKSTIIIGVGIGVAFIQLLGIVLACLLAAAIRRGDGK